MKTFQKAFYRASELQDFSVDFEPDVFFIFISPNFEEPKPALACIQNKYPNAQYIGCSTAGEIIGSHLVDSSMVVSAIQFEKSKVRALCTVLNRNDNDSYAIGKYLSEELYTKDLKHIFVISDGLLVNGAELVSGLSSVFGDEVGITGGLAADNDKFENTFVVSNSGIHAGKVVALGIYGDSIKVSFGSKGGWDSFGLERLVTKSDKNILYELDGKPALDLYKSFLGDKAEDLPSSGLLFPLSLRDTNYQKPVVRTILGVDEESKSLKFAGNIPEGSYVRLMNANIDRLISGAEQSARAIDEKVEIAFLISCVGRRLVLKQFAEEEIEAVTDVLGHDLVYTGFYSYGEIAPFESFTPCSLHNQTMTITTFSE